MFLLAQDSQRQAETDDNPLNLKHMEHLQEQSVAMEVEI
jgi:hypothetical protein